MNLREILLLLTFNLNQMEFFEIEGGTKLKGEINIPGAKNAALPMFCAALLTTEKCVFKNVPDISDLHNLCAIFNEIGVETSWDLKTKTVEIWAKNLNVEKLATNEKVKKMRASILMAGPVLARTGKFEIFAPGGCVIGARSNEIHTNGFETLGAELLRDDEKLALKFSREKYTNKRILFSEASVTGTENLAMFAAGVEDEVELFFTAAEPHVKGMLRMLQKMGAEISGIETQHLKIRGNKNLHGGEFEIPSDGLLVGTYAIAGWITGGELVIKNVVHEDLYSFYGACKKIGANFEMEEGVLRVLPTKKLTAITKVQTAIFPGFPTDLQSPFGVLLTQCEGTSKIFETLFENRLSYLAELERMGAKIEMLNAHEARILGPTKLRGAEVQSWDLRAGAAMVIAGLVAEGQTRVTNINYIDRGYENFEQNLQNCGAKIRRVEGV
jgi:UDP-N-acetylglucosamine 1-carboxyvinyltransferase